MVDSSENDQSYKEEDKRFVDIDERKYGKIKSSIKETPELEIK